MQITMKCRPAITVLGLMLLLCTTVALSVKPGCIPCSYVGCKGGFVQCATYTCNGNHVTCFTSSLAPTFEIWF
jgi:hypothetical protein